MNAFLYWLRTRWRSRRQYTTAAHRWIVVFGRALAPLALLLLGLAWVLGGPSRSGAREARIEGLADRIVATVERGGHGPLATLEDYVAAGVLTPDDVEFLADRRVVFQPIRSDSPDTAVVFRRPSGGVERVYRKDGSEDHYTVATSGDGRFTVVVGTPPAGAEPRRAHRSVTVRDAGNGRILGSFLAPDYARARWSPDGRFVAIETRPEDDSRVASLETFVLAVDDSSFRRLELPDGVMPEALVAPEDRLVRFQSTSVRVLRWRGSTLEVESSGHG